MYFSSPGGNLEHAIFIGNMLREMSATARVARTIVKDCGFEAQTSEVCLKLKRSGRELAADLTTKNTQCNSACPYLILGATTREIAPDAILGVHSPKVVLRYSGGAPTREMVSAATQRGVERADKLLSGYVVKMGIEGELLDVAKHTKFEDMHVLTRDEIFRFGIDRREFVETPWAFENLGRALIRKSAISRGENGKTWRTLQWRLFCLNTEQFQLDFQRQVTTSPPFAAISISSGAAKPFTFVFPPAKPAGYEVWGLRMPKSSAQAIADLPQIDLTETANALDGRRLAHGEKLSTEGLAASLASLQGICRHCQGIFRKRTFRRRMRLCNICRKRCRKTAPQNSSCPSFHARADVAYMHLHACSGSAHRPPLRSHRIDARKFRHRLRGDRAGGDAGRIVIGP